MTGQLEDFLRVKCSIDGQQLTTIVAAFKPQTIKRNEVILQAGNICDEFYFIERGGLRVFFLTQQGQEKTRHIALEGTIITAMSSFISQQPSAEIIEALEDTELLTIGHDDFFHLVRTCRAWELFYRTILETAYITQTKRVETRVTLSAKQRFDAVSRENPHYLQRLSNRILASYLDITQETLSRLKSR